METKDVVITKTLGERFALAFAEDRSMFEKSKGLRINLPFETKAASDPVTSTSGRTLFSAGVGSPGVVDHGFQYGMSQRSVGGISAVEYSRFTEVTGDGGVQAGEGVAKDALRPEHTLITQSALTVAGWTVMSKQALNDSAELKNCVDITLQDRVQRNLSAMLLSGNVAPAFDGFATLADTVVSGTYENLADALSEHAAMMISNGFKPDTVIISAETWTLITLLVGTDYHPLTGNYLGKLPSEMRGLKVVFAGVPSGKAYLLDSRHCELLICDDFSIEMAYVNDQFTKNLVTLLGECRVIPTYKTAGACRLVSPKP